MAEALYRKYRPQVFEDVVGQEPIERTLKNAIAQDKVSHAYLLCGPRGTGKTTTARLLAKALLCQKGQTPDPDGTCEDCQLIAEGVHPDVYELDAASRTGVENVREEIISRVSFAPTRGRYKVYIIDEVHMLSTAAFNALLKTLEEPPSHVVFVLCTTDPQKVPETIHSRCQRFDFRRIAPESMVSRLGAICIAEDVEFEGEALDLIAHRAEGGLRNALTSLEQIIAFENGRVTLAGAERLLGSIDSNDMAEILLHIGKRDVASCFRWTAAYVETGADLAQFVRDMAEHVRNMYVMSLVGDDADLDINETVRHELAGELQWFGSDRLARLLGVLGDLTAELKTSSNPRLAFEIALTRMVRPDSDLTLESLAERIEALEGGYSAVAHVMPGAAAGAPSAMGMPVAGAAAGAAFAEAGVDAGVAESVAAGIDAQVETMPREAVVSPAVERPIPQGGQAAQGAAAPVSDPVAGSLSADRQPAPARSAEPAQAVSAGQGAAALQGAPAGQATAAAQAAMPAAGAASALANPASLQRVWQATLSAVKKHKQAYGVLFMGTKVRYDDASGMVRIAFPEENTFAFNAVQKPDVQEALGAALAKAAGAQVGFAYERMGAAASTAAVAAAASASIAASGSADTSTTVAATPAEGSAPVQAAVAPVHSPDAADAAFVFGQGDATSTHNSPVASNTAVAASAADADGALSPQPAPAEPSDSGSGAFAEDDFVPYEDLPYEPVPYGEFDGAADTAPEYRPVPDGGLPAVDAGMPAPASGPSAADAGTSPSPSEPNLTPEGAIAEDPSDVEALLQAGFGGGVVFEEVDG